MTATSSIAPSQSNVKQLTRYGRVPAWWASACTSSAALRILTALATFDNPTRGCFPSYAVLERTTDLKKRAIAYNLSKLEESGLIVRERGKNMTRYHLIYDQADYESSKLSQVQVACTFASASGMHSPTIEQTKGTDYIGSTGVEHYADSILSGPRDTAFGRPRKRRLQNDPEHRFEVAAKQRGWQTSKRGWPDFMCLRDGEFAAVEVKPRRGGKIQRLKREQTLCMLALQRAGIKCLVSDGDVVEEFNLKMHGHRFIAGGVLLPRITNIRSVKLPDAPQASRRPADPNVQAVLTAFSSYYFVALDTSMRARNVAKLLLTLYGGIDNVMAAAQRAKEREHELCKNGSKFTLSTVYFYAKYFDTSVDDALAVNKNQKESLTFLRLLVGDDRFEGFRYKARLCGLSREQLLAEFGEWWCGLLDVDPDQVADYVSRNPKPLRRTNVQ